LFGFFAFSRVLERVVEAEASAARASERTHFADELLVARVAEAEVGVELLAAAEDDAHRTLVDGADERLARMLLLHVRHQLRLLLELPLAPNATNPSTRHWDGLQWEIN